MIYLHKSVFQSHGYLSSANCHVDSRWVLKVSGFALHAFREENTREQVDKHFSLLLQVICFHISSTRLQPPLAIHLGQAIGFDSVQCIVKSVTVGGIKNSGA